MILVDSSVWIDFFSSAPGTAGFELGRLIEESEPIALAGIIVAEVLQGVTRDVERIEHYLWLWEMLEPRGFDTYRSAAALSRQARSRGVTLTTVDALIAALAVENKAALLSLDQDFSRIAGFSGLELHRPTPKI